jgi:hypothetical protein
MLAAARIAQTGNVALTVSDLATGAGTLVLAVATFAAVRSANRSARRAEESMRASLRPVLMHSRFNDPGQKVSYADGTWVVLPAGGAAVEAAQDAIYLAISVRNAGTGMAILHGWRVRVSGPGRNLSDRPALDQFTAQTRDMYVAPGGLGFWSGALRDPLQDLFGEVAAKVKAQGTLHVDLLYADFEGGQRVSRFNVTYREHGQLSRPGPDGGPPAARPGPAAAPPQAAAGSWLAAVVRHWNVDRPDPR